MELRTRLRELAKEGRRFGYNRLLIQYHRKGEAVFWCSCETMKLWGFSIAACSILKSDLPAQPCERATG